jgi:hypothetical protein
LRHEREALAYHARLSGAKLIINPKLQINQYEDDAKRNGQATSPQKIRLTELLNFLKNADAKVDIAIGDAYDFPIRGDGAHSVYVSVGDWFSAEAIHRRGGPQYWQTVFTTHAASVRRRNADFDRAFHRFRQARDGPLARRLGDSREAAIEYIEEILSEIVWP